MHDMLARLFDLIVLVYIMVASKPMPSSASTFVVDVHTHPIPEFYRDALIGAGYATPTKASLIIDGFVTPNFTIEGYLASRNQYGYNFSILSITAPGVSFLHGNLQAKVLARRLNDQMNEYIQQHPMQLSAFGILPLMDIQSSLEEIAVCSPEILISYKSELDVAVLPRCLEIGRHWPLHQLRRRVSWGLSARSRHGRAEQESSRSFCAPYRPT